MKLARSIGLFSVGVVSAVLTVAPEADVGAINSWAGTVTVVEDGDTFYVDVGGALQHIRVAGVNTNEVNRLPKCFADEATTRLKSLIEGKTVRLEATNAGATADGRLVRHVFYQGENIAEIMLREGYGTPIIFLEQGELDYAVDYLAAYASARRSGLGIHDVDRCGAGPRTDFPVTMTTNGDADGSDFSNVNGEFVRLRNSGPSPFPLGGWQLKDTALEFYEFPTTASIPAGGSLTLRVGIGTDTSTTLYMGRTSPIFSGADGAFLLDPDGDVRAQNTWPCVGHCSDDPVPSVTITGLNYDIPGNDDDDPNGEWFDLRNDGLSSIDLQDWRFESFPHVRDIEDSIILAPGATVRVRIGVGVDSSSEVFMNRTHSILNNTGDSVLAITPAGDVAACEAFGDQTCSWHPSKSPTMRDGADFNGDGWSDLVVGSPGESVGSVSAAGAVLVRYGRDLGVRVDGAVFGIAPVNQRFLSQSGPMTGGSETGDEFGYVHAAGDFNGDGYDDLAIGVPGEAVGSVQDAGIVHVIKGGPLGIDPNDDFTIQPGQLLAGGPTANSRFGESLAVGDFNADGLEDLAIGQPGISGAAAVLYGQPTSGTVVLGAGTWFSQAGAVDGTPELGDRFGDSLAAGDFNGDGYDDLAVGAPGEALGTITAAGLVHILQGTSSGVTKAGDFTVHQGDGVVGWAEALDRFGESLAVGDFDGDGIDDLAVGSPGEAIGSRSGAGAVIVAFGDDAGLRAGPSQWMSQSGNLPGTAESTDEVGATLAALDFNDDGVDDLAVGAPGEAIGSRSDSGLVSLAYGPLRSTFSTDTLVQGGNLGGAAESGDRVGSWLGVSDHDGDGTADLVIGAAGENIGSIIDAGLIHLVRGSENGIGAVSGWTQSPFGGGVESGDRFGS